MKLALSATTARRSRLACALAFAFAAAPVAAQMPELPFKLPSFLTGASAPAPAQPATNTAAPAALAPKTNLERAATGAAAQGGAGESLADLKPDVDCSRPQEGFDVMAKVVEYGGENARLRLQRLVATDFRYDDLTPQDRALLKVVAYTTVWVPPALESKLGALYAGFSPGGEESHSALARRAMERIELLKQQVSDFPGEVRLVVLKDMPSGATAQAGGLISIAQGFASDLDATPTARDLILAHELSHVYKRHALKEIQYQLVSTSAGFSIAKRLLGRAMPGAGAGGGLSVITEGLATLQLGVELVNFVKGLQIRFGRDQELEADACAAVWMKRAQMDTTDAWKAFETASAAGGQGGSYFESHPSSSERKARFVASVKRQEAPPGQQKTPPGQARKQATAPPAPKPKP